jgi:hypothetical protein
MRPPIVKRAIAMTQATVQGERAATKEKPPAADKPAAPRAVAPRAPERPACVFKPVMTDAELAACR